MAFYFAAPFSGMIPQENAPVGNPSLYYYVDPSFPSLNFKEASLPCQ